MQRYTPKQIEERFDEAARVMDRLPAVKRPRLSMLQLPIVHDRNTAYGYEVLDADRVMRKIPPSAASISDMEKAMDWLLLLPDVDDRRIVWLRACGHKWKHVQGRVGLSRAAAWRRWCAALITISLRVDMITNQIIEGRRLTSIERPKIGPLGS